ncbi:MAG: YeeE/YedE thiosulfate transporter family protein [Halanaerobiales bacterium]|nr:YeeE/YedE thiosulfate transporter family protein [Halanaerobiales bacterium]
MQRSRICFTAAFRDPILFGMTELARAIVISLIITTVGFYILQYYQLGSGLEISGKFTPLGWHIPIGAFVFGVGAAISGGCASGTLVRAGEGFHMQWVVILSFIIGSVHGAQHSDFWYSFFQVDKSVHLPTILGWKTGLIIQLLFLIILYIALYYHEKKKFPLTK